MYIRFYTNIVFILSLLSNKRDPSSISFIYPKRKDLYIKIVHYLQLCSDSEQHIIRNVDFFTPITLCIITPLFYSLHTNQTIFNVSQLVYIQHITRYKICLHIMSYIKRIMCVQFYIRQYT